MTLTNTFFIATISEEGKITIHRATTSPAKAILYQSQKIADGLKDVKILRKTTGGEYVDTEKGGTVQ